MAEREMTRMRSPQSRFKKWCSFDGACVSSYPSACLLFFNLQSWDPIGRPSPISSNDGVGRNTSKDDASIHVCGGTKREDGDGDSSKCNFVSADT
ncbi:hypothetical protein PVAP13_9KG369504 [Panicum virgatum]|uniref:Uncharacterized protein n=1 Tax=Panicum virgatum TaxID=38727 RepID=A0A8T0NP71_PANVG|nr:hypothetical protein PVAP13_9KG369504 [Panicum virgatum]